MDEENKPPQIVEYGTRKAYAFGFVSSILLVLVSYFVTVKQMFSGFTLVLIVSALGSFQALIQFILFFNLLKEPKPRWNILVFLFMVLVVLLLVLGSLWIMHHLDYNMMM